MGAGQSLSMNYEAVNLVSNATHRYAAWYDMNRELWVGKQAIGANWKDWTTHQMSGAARTALGLPVELDSHNYPAIAIDSQGYLHVWANMHVHPLRYVRSDAADDISAWSAATLTNAASYTRWTYPVPIKRPNGTLRFIIRAGGTGSGPGRSNTYSWEESGGNWGSDTLLFRGVDGAYDSPATDTTNNFSVYPVVPYVEDHGDGSWTEHWFFSWRQAATDLDNLGLSYVKYVSSVGQWQDISGNTVTLPITKDHTGLYVGAFVGQDLNWIQGGGCTLDGDGNPHAVIGTASGAGRHHVWHNGTAWQEETLPSTLGSRGISNRLNCAWAKGNLWYIGLAGASTRPTVWRADGVVAFTATPAGVDNSYGYEVRHDPEALRLRGSIEVLGPRDSGSPFVGSFGTGARSGS